MDLRRGIKAALAAGNAAGIVILHLGIARPQIKLVQILTLPGLQTALYGCQPALQLRQLVLPGQELLLQPIG
ncbi:hypothetical protein SDC9_198870 [bioreactor metagenome]|uniref:Uncharacterized protein n=1 Tax=bioreactor metagenome TaxID=1076179 RepID=A0A645IIW3_9ZZZZ